MAGCLTPIGCYLVLARHHVTVNVLEEIVRNLKMPVPQLLRIVPPFGVLACHLNRARMRRILEHNVTPERLKIFGHAELVDSVVHYLPYGSKSLNFLTRIHAGFRAVIQNPIALFHTCQRCLFAVANLAESARNAE